MKRIQLVSTTILLITLAGSGDLLAQGTALTYQGRLNDGPNSANGVYDLRFALFNSDTDTNVLAGPLTNAPTSVSNGLFAVTLDFGVTPFNGAPLWLEIGVRTNGSAADYETLSPRQSITSAPYAIQALNANGVVGSVSAALLTSPGNTTGGGNFFVGPAGNSTTTGLGNTANGQFALKNNTSGSYNTANGYLSLNLNTNGVRNTAEGAYAIFENSSGSDNVSIGYETLYFNTNGNNNVALGNDALEFLKTGNNNIAIGYGAGTAISTGSSNIDIGNPGFGNETGVIRIGTTQTKAVMVGISGGNIVSSAGLVCVNPSGLLGTVCQGGASLNSSLEITGNLQNDGNLQNNGNFQNNGNVQIGTGSGDYRRLTLGGGNSSGFLYGSYPAFGDGLHLGYNYYADAAGGNHIINAGGRTSRLTVGYGEIDMWFGGVNAVPIIQTFLANSGGVTVYGTFNNNSDRNAKQDFAPISASQILDKVLQLPLSEWSYKVDSATRHIGPVAQDFHSTFNIGTDDKHIAPIDEGGVALAAIQGLNEKVEDRTEHSNARIEKLETENAELKQKNDSLEKRLEKLETLLSHELNRSAR